VGEIDPEEAERTADELQRTLLKLSKEFDKIGEKRMVAGKIAASLQAEVKDFMNESIPLMLLVCNPGKNPYYILMLLVCDPDKSPYYIC